MPYGKEILDVLIFPGLLFAAVMGLITSWVDRKVTARVQMRVGPPLLQPFYDVVKLMIKETTIPVGAPVWLFLLAPLVGLAAVSLASTVLWRAMLSPLETFVADLIVILYLLTMPSLAVILGAFASRNPLASVGGSREMKLVMAYELPFVLAVFVPVIQLHTIRLGEIVSAPAAVTLPSGILALLVSIICMQAKLTLVPFDSPEAETELTGGAFIEYSGPPLGIYKLTRAMMLFTMPVFLVVVFCGGIEFHSGWLHAVLGALKWVGLVVVIVLIRNTAPRLRVDQSIKLFWGPATVVALVAVLLALLGH